MGKVEKKVQENQEVRIKTQVEFVNDLINYVNSMNQIVKDFNYTMNALNDAYRDRLKGGVKDMNEDRLTSRKKGR